jgi:hypothetical protein
MTFEDFIAACPTAQVVFTTDGAALLIGGVVIQFKGSDWNYATHFAKALQMVPTEQPMLDA